MFGAIEFLLWSFSTEISIMELSIMSWGHVDPRLGGQREWRDKGSEEKGFNCDVWLRCIVKNVYGRVLSRLKIVLWKECFFCNRGGFVSRGFPQGVSKLAFCFQNSQVFQVKFPKSDLSVSIKNVAWDFLQVKRTGDLGFDSMWRCFFSLFSKALMASNKWAWFSLPTSPSPLWGIWIPWRFPVGFRDRTWISPRFEKNSCLIHQTA